MTPERFQRVDQLVSLALERGASERGQFIREACGADEDLRTEVESLLACHEKEGDFLGEAPCKLAAQLLTENAQDRDSASVALTRNELALGRYKVLEELGVGGMGVVYAAHDPELGRKVAIKLLHPQASGTISVSEGRARLLREAHAMAKLAHPNVIAVHDVGTEGDQVFIVMEHVEGSTLAAWLSERARPWREVLSMFVQAGRGLAAAHAAGILHRDFKPENVLVGNDGRPRVMDFGLARAAQSLNGPDDADPDAPTLPSPGSPPHAVALGAALTEPGKLLGTPRYMAPEQLIGEPASEKTDQYSFCVALFEGLYCELPFNSENLGALLDRISQRRVNRVPKLNDVPSPLRQVLLRGLSADSVDRFPSMEVLLGKLERQLAVQRHRTLIVASVVILISILGALVYVPRGSSRSISTGASNSASSATSIAVLPFASLSSGEENAYFAQGFHGELLRQIGRIGDLQVISRTSVMQYKEGTRNLREIAEALGVSSIVEGSVQRAGNRVRVEARLIDARNDRQIWADHYDRDVTDVFTIQTAVAEEIARALDARLSSAQKAQLARKPTQSAEAYDLYLRALDYQNRPGFQPNNLGIAEGLYRKAIQIDSSFALARAQLAYVRMATFWIVAGTPDRVAEEAREEAEQSLRLQPDLPEGHLALGGYHYWARRDYDRALEEFKIARPGLPAATSLIISMVARRQGKFEEAIRTQQEALRLDPRSPDTLNELAASFRLIRRYEEADRVLDRALTIAPDFVAASIVKAIVHEAWKGETDLAKDVLRALRGRLDPRGLLGGYQRRVTELLQHNPREALSLLASVESESIGGSPGDRAALYPRAFFSAVAHEALGHAAQARREYETALLLLQAEVVKNPSSATQLVVLARVYASLGRKKDALREARRAVGLLPISKDACTGPDVEIDRAAVEARVGETDAAIEHIRHLLSIPSLLSPGLLRIDPRWAPLRDDPRFRKLAELDRE